MKQFMRGPLPYIMLLTAIMLFLVTFAMRGPNVADLTVTEFESKLAAGEVSAAVFDEGGQVITGELKDGSAFETAYPYRIQQDIVARVREAGVEVAAKAPTGPGLGLLLLQYILPVALIIGALYFFMSQSGAGGNKVMAFGKSRHKVVGKDQPKTTFDDVAGVDEAIEELQEVKDFLENPEKFQKMGAKIPRGVLLIGPPGTGKTLLARAVAGEAGVPFFSISGSDFVEMFVGVGAARVRDLFEQAKQSAPAIVFIDEIDAVGRHRGAGMGGGHDEREQTLNQLLVEMDGFDQRSTVILMAATNRPDILDPALLRPGRFDRQVVVDRPDLEGRKGILKVHAKGKPLAGDVDLDTVAKRTPGFTGADLSNVINEGALLAARRDKTAITTGELTEAIDRVMAGPERKSRVMSDHERRVTAYHEGGHALVAHVLPNSDPVHKITVIPRGRALGYTLTLPEEDRFSRTREELSDELAMLLGGRVAEELVMGDITTGASNDIERATKVARQMVMEFGMSDKLGPLTLGTSGGEPFLGRDWGSTPDYSDQVAFEIDLEVRGLIDRAHDEALEILTDYRTQLDLLATTLLEVETLEREAVEELLVDAVKRQPRIPAEHGGSLAVARRAVQQDRADKGGGTLGDKHV